MYPAMSSATPRSPLFSDSQTFPDVHQLGQRDLSLNSVGEGTLVAMVPRSPSRAVIDKGLSVAKPTSVKAEKDCFLLAVIKNLFSAKVSSPSINTEVPTLSIHSLPLEILCHILSMLTPVERTTRRHPGPLATTSKLFAKALSTFNRPEDLMAQRIAVLRTACELGAVLCDLGTAPGEIQRWASTEVVWTIHYLPKKIKAKALSGALDFVKQHEPVPDWSLSQNWMQIYARLLPEDNSPVFDMLLDKALELQGVARHDLLCALSERATWGEFEASKARWNRIYGTVQQPLSVDAGALIYFLRRGIHDLHLSNAERARYDALRQALSDAHRSLSRSGLTIKELEYFNRWSCQIRPLEPPKIKQPVKRSLGEAIAYFFCPVDAFDVNDPHLAEKRARLQSAIDRAHER